VRGVKQVPYDGKSTKKIMIALGASLPRWNWSPESVKRARRKRIRRGAGRAGETLSASFL